MASVVMINWRGWKVEKEGGKAALVADVVRRAAWVALLASALPPSMESEGKRVRRDGRTREKAVALMKPR